MAGAGHDDQAAVREDPAPAAEVRGSGRGVSVPASSRVGTLHDWRLSGIGWNASLGNDPASAAEEPSTRDRRLGRSSSPSRRVPSPRGSNASPRLGAENHPEGHEPGERIEVRPAELGRRTWWRVTCSHPSPRRSTANGISARCQPFRRATSTVQAISFGVSSTWRFGASARRGGRASNSLSCRLE